MIAEAHTQLRTRLMSRAVVIGTKPGLAAVGSATIALTSESSGIYIEQPFLCHKAGSRALQIVPFTVHI